MTPALRTGALLIALLALAPPANGRPQPEKAIGPRTTVLLERWQARFAREGLVAVAAPPFVIAGDGGRRRLEQYRDGTILAAARALRATYFRTPPAEPVLILLFESEAPYRRLAKKWFSDTDVSPYGYFRQGDRVMLMNVGTGTGTLVHELTHALMQPDFPDVPDWFNEGLASLYEQCSLGRDTITGHENWRLPALQDAIRAGKLRPLAKLIQDPDFRSDDLEAMNYAQARYLMFYLQEKGLLPRYYREFREGHRSDPTGLATLKKLIAPQPWEQFEKEWRAWVLTLRFAG